MSNEAFIIRRGGGAGKAYAVISVTYPAGSTITCTHSDTGKTIKPQGVDGQALFLVPYAGWWIIDITDGTNSERRLVYITTEGQSVSIELRYKLWLYKNGNEYTDTTGGWEKRAQTNGSGGSLTKGTSSMTATGASNTNFGGCGGGTVNAIDLRSINTIYVNVLSAARGSAADISGYVIVIAESVTNPTAPNALASTQLTGAALGIISLDVSDVDEGVVCVIGYAGKGFIEFDQVWGE